MTQKRRKQRSKKPRFARDPFAEREAEKYQSPIPSREFIMSVLADAGRLMTREDLVAAFGLQGEDDIEALRRRLRAMERDGQLLRNRRGGYGLVDRMDMVRGRIIAHPDGFGFLVPDEGGEDLFMAAREMRQVMHGDRVVARVAGIDQRGRREGAMVEVSGAQHPAGGGASISKRGISFRGAGQQAHDPGYPDSARGRGGARHGQIVTVEIIEQPDKNAPAVGRVVEIIGDHLAPGMEIDVAMRAHDAAPRMAGAAWRTEIQGLNDEVSPAAKRGREDLRALAAGDHRRRGRARF